MKKIWIMNMLALIVLVSPASAEFYRYTDPHGNVILGYPPDADRSQLLKDLKRLLKLSTIG